MSRIISYRGLMADLTQDTIPLHTNDGKTGYKIVKLEGIPNTPGTTAIQESVIKIYSIEQTTIDGTVDFSDGTLLGTLYVKMDASDEAPSTINVIFDNVKFNQDIYITHQDVSVGTESCNYYLELEQIDLTEDQALVAIVKNLRNEQ